MSITIPGLRAAVTHAKHAGQSPKQLKQHIADLTADNGELIGDNQDLVCQFTQAIISGCQDRARIAQLETDLNTAVDEVKRLQRKVIRSAAEHERLRQAVINARPRITQVDTQLVRPYAPVVAMPYVSPLDYDTPAPAA